MPPVSAALCILMIFLIIVFQVVVAVRDAIRTLPEERYYPLYSLGASLGQIFRFVILPASLPKFITAIRVAMATAVSVLFFTETFGTQYGMEACHGCLAAHPAAEMYAGILVLSVMGALLLFPASSIALSAGLPLAAEVRRLAKNLFCGARHCSSARAGGFHAPELLPQAQRLADDALSHFERDDGGGIHVEGSGAACADVKEGGFCL